MDSPTKIRVNTDADTVDFEYIGTAVTDFVEHIATHGVWVNMKMLYPPSRIVSIEVLD